MKRFYFLLIAFFSLTVLCAQQLQEVVQLSNGSIVRGNIIEQVPNKYLKIKTYDGSIYVYNMEEVIKITKEATPSYLISDKNPPKTIFGIPVQNKYHWSLEFGHVLGIGEDGSHKVELTTSHGFQINPYIYAGLGLGFSGFYYDEAIGIPFFAHIKANFKETKQTSFIDTKIGYSFCDIYGAYFSIAYGYRLNWFKKVTMSASIGYTWEYSNGISTKISFDF